MSVSIVGGNVTKTVFPGGESCIRVGGFPAPVATIDLKFESNSDLFDLALLVDAMRRINSEIRLKLFMAYAPYARQDRVCNPGESLSIRVVADFINSMGFEQVAIVDPHSDVTTAVFNNLKVYTQDAYAGRFMKYRANTVIVAPDAGAAKKARKFAERGGFDTVIQAEKVRDLMTGRILETRLSSTEHIGDKNFLIVDDICDGGRTFTELAKVLRPYTDGKIMLYVTHGIFSAGAEVFDNLIDVVYTANPVGATGAAAVASGKVKQL